MPTVEELRAKCIEQLAALKAEEALSRDISRVIKVAQIRQQVYSNALPAARAGARVENLEWWSRTVKIVAVTAVGVAVAAYAAPIATAYLAQTSGTALSWLSSNVTITATIAGKTATVATVSAGTLAIGAALSPTTGLKWPVFARKAQGPLGFPFLLENHAMESSSLVGLLFEWHCRAKIAAAIDAIERDFMGMVNGAWPGWEDVKIIPAVVSDEFNFITSIDVAVHRQILASGASAGEAYLKKVEICLGFWKKLEEYLIQHRIKHNYQGSIAGLQLAADGTKHLLELATATQRR